MIPEKQSYIFIKIIVQLLLMHHMMHGTRLKRLTTKQIFQRLPIALPQVKAYNNSENLLNEIRQIVYFLYQSNKLLKKYAITSLNQHK